MEYGKINRRCVNARKRSEQLTHVFLYINPTGSINYPKVIDFPKTSFDIKQMYQIIFKYTRVFSGILLS